MANGRFNISRADNIPHTGLIGPDFRHTIRTNTHASETAHTFKGIDDCHPGIGYHAFLGKDAGGPGSGRLGLGDRLVQKLGIVGQPGHKDAVGGEVNRAQLDVGLEEEAVHIDRQFELAGQLSRPLGRHDRRAQHQQIGPQFQIPVQQRFPHLNAEGSLGATINIRSAGRLNDRFRLLAGGRRTALPRQKTLQALIDWSWNLLDQKEQRLLRRLSIFSGGWTLDAAQIVTADDRLDEFEVFDLLEQLVNKSLVTVSHPPAGEVRYGMLESIRQYSRDRLLDSSEEETLRQCHAGYFVAFAEEAGPHLAWSTNRSWVPRVVADLDNLRAALSWALEKRPELALRIAANLFYNEALSLTPREAASWLEPAIEKARLSMDQEANPFRPLDYLKALIALAIAIASQGGQEKARAMLEETVQLARTLDWPRYAAIAIAGRQMINPFTLSAETRQEMEAVLAICRHNHFHLELFNLLLVYALSLEVQGDSELAGALEKLAGAMGQQERDKVMAQGALLDLDAAVESALS